MPTSPTEENRVTTSTSENFDPTTEAVAPEAAANVEQAETKTVKTEAAQAPVQAETPATEAAPEKAEEPTGPTFADLGLDARLLAAVTDLGYERPSPIQAATIPLLLEGRDVVGLAQTGTGKTAAFAVPALSRIAELNDVNGKPSIPQVLVLAPTRELALQVAEAFSSYAKYVDQLSILPIYGGSPYGPQLSALRRGVQVVVGTPGRVIDHLDRGALDLSGLQYLVLDEADEMLRMGFAEEVDHILESTPADKQVALFSATMPRQIRRIAEKYLRNPEQVSVDAVSSAGVNIRQRYLQVMHSHKLDVMARILETEDHDGIIAFVRTKVAAEDVASKLKARGFRAVAIHGDIAQQQRERTVENLREGQIDILVATDVAARGLDVERISHVFNYDVPHDTESYVHRIGRTGRAGRQGDAVLFITPRERFLLKHIEKATGNAVTEVPIPGIEAVNKSRLGRLAAKVTKARSSKDISQYRELVTDYLAEHDVDPIEVAAAFAHLAQGGRPLLTEEIAVAPLAKQARAGKRTRDAFASRGPSKPLGAGNATYRISVGHQQRVLPGSIVGALANEGGMHSGDIGSIDIRADHSLIELPAKLSPDTLAKLSSTRIGGRLINLEPDTGRRPSDSSDEGDRRAPRRDNRGDDRRGDNRRDKFAGRGERRDDRRGSYERPERNDRGGERGGYARPERGASEQRDDRQGYGRNDRREAPRDADRTSRRESDGDRGGKGGFRSGGNSRNDGGFQGGYKSRKPRH
ncbi:DEAD/DEAH box helicase [Galactobacter caseinivorans]|uniref:DEAD/DEAH box helicase n=1 Tax=Galactobacter caseinivorans TaxID=2676123 RepID=UPI0018F70EF1